jgi:hypothetical protein
MDAEKKRTSGKKEGLQKSDLFPLVLEDRPLTPTKKALQAALWTT